MVGYEFSLPGRAKEAERLEETHIYRFATLRSAGETPVVSSDNGLVFQSRRFRAALRDYRLRGAHHPLHPGAERKLSGRSAAEPDFDT
jgi:putative transposase